MEGETALGPTCAGCPGPGSALGEPTATSPSDPWFRAASGEPQHRRETGGIGSGDSGQVTRKPEEDRYLAVSASTA